ncbi:hypothetical protein T484DRAFT_1754290 [Baffinella frigidus]|nr:hypothetical protein T484DRAFT_1754290 [Cryptophyta sp. CCMP2293]
MVAGSVGVDSPEIELVEAGDTLHRPRRHAAKSVTWDTHAYIRVIPALTTPEDAGISAEVLANALTDVQSLKDGKIEGGESGRRRKTVSWAAYVNIRSIPARSEQESQRQD